jgi:TonB family protein
MAVKFGGRSGAPTPLAALRAAGGADLLVLSTDARLVDMVRHASAERLPVSAVSSWTEIETALLATRCAIVIVDADLLGDAPHARIAALDVYSHKVVLLVAADRLSAEGLMGLLSERKVHRLLIKPAAVGITRLLIDSAVSRCLRLNDLAQVHEEARAEAGEETARVLAARRSAPIPAWVIAVAAAALLAGVAVIAGLSSWWRSPADEAGFSIARNAGAPAQLVPRVANAPPAEEVTASDSRSTGSPSTDAFEQFLAAVAADPTDDGARQQLERLVAALFADAEQALLANRPAAAAAALAAVRRADPQSSRLAFLEAQLERSRLAVVASSAPRDVSTSTRANSTSVASEYLDRAEQLAPGDAGVGAIRRELAAALVTAAREALAARHVENASVLATEARVRGADAEALARLETELAAARSALAAQRRAEWRLAAENRLRAGALIAPVDDSARYYLLKLRDEAGDRTGVDALWPRFETAVAGEVAAALVARDWSAAEAALAALEEAPRGVATAAPLRAQLELGRLEQHYLTVVAPASDLDLVERVTPAYPAEASRRGIEGWVDVEFVVDVTGRTGGLVVVGAEPEGSFEAATLAALREYRYRPFVRDGRAFARRVGLRMRFALE